MALVRLRALGRVGACARPVLRGDGVALLLRLRLRLRHACSQLAAERKKLEEGM